MTYSVNIVKKKFEPETVRRVAVLSIDGSPSGGGRTLASLEVLAGFVDAAGGAAEIVSLAEAEGFDRALAALDEVDAVVLGAPVYRAAAAAPLKQLLDLIPRDRDGRSPLSAKPVMIVQTGASLHHFLALDGLRSVLGGFFAAHVIPPGLYVPRDAWSEDGRLDDVYADQASTQARALVELARLLEPGSALASVRPQA
jgi:FMN reductase